MNVPTVLPYVTICTKKEVYSLVSSLC